MQNNLNFVQLDKLDLHNLNLDLVLCPNYLNYFEFHPLDLLDPVDQLVVLDTDHPFYCLDHMAVSYLDSEHCLQMQMWLIKLQIKVPKLLMKTLISPSNCRFENHINQG